MLFPTERQDEISHPLPLISENSSEYNAVSPRGLDSSITYIYYKTTQINIIFKSTAKVGIFSKQVFRALNKP